MGWVARTLDHVGLFQPAVSFVEAVLAAKLGRGSIQITLRDMLEFVLTVWLAYLVSAFIRFVLREDVYPHTRLTRGLSYAISSLLNYVIITLGFLLALGVLGLDLTKVTVLAGAFGVGIGFGLQSVVNNFVSGLILLFERPVHVGDIVEVGSISGEVSRIGIRASTLRTWQGAEVIVPNAQLVTEQVTNWTLSDRTRRIDLPVGVDYGSAPDKVVDGARGGGASAPADHADASAPGRLQVVRRQLDQLRAARLDEPLRALARDPDGAGGGHLRGAARGGDVAAVPSARGAPRCAMMRQGGRTP